MPFAWNADMGVARAGSGLKMHRSRGAGIGLPRRLCRVRRLGSAHRWVDLNEESSRWLSSEDFGPGLVSIPFEAKNLVSVCTSLAQARIPLDVDPRVPPLIMQHSSCMRNDVDS